MKRLVLLALFALALRTYGGDVVWYLKDSQGTIQANRQLFLFYLTAPTNTFSTNLITRDRIVKTTDSAGYTILTNYTPGIWRSEHQGTFGVTTNWYLFPVTNGTIYAADPQWQAVATNTTVGVLTPAAGDARYVQNNGPGSNVALSAGGALALSVSNTPLTVIVPSTATTNSTTASVLIQSPSGTTNSYPLIVVLKTNQSFVIQDEAGNNLFGIRHDTYPTSAARHWEVSFGSKEQGLIDQLFDMGAGADIGWRINGDLNQSFFMATSTSGIEYRYANSNYFLHGLGTGAVLFDNYGRVHAEALYGDFVQQNQTVVAGAAAGTGGSVGAEFDEQASDVSVQIIFTTGHTGLGAGTLFTYTLENASAVFDATVLSVPIKPVFSAAGANAAGVSAAVYCTATGTGFTFKSTTALTADTTYAWNFFICR